MGQHRRAAMGESVRLGRRGLTPMVVALLVLGMLSGVPAGPVAAAAGTDTPGTALLSWGSNESGDLGRGVGSIDGYKATPVQVALPDGVNPIAVAAGQSVGLAVTDDGDVYSWGNNEGGHGPTTDPPSDTPERVDLPGAVSATAVAAGIDHSLALGSDGAVYAWGDNSEGQIGDGKGEPGQANPVKADMPGAVSATAIAAGGDSSLALGADGIVYAWGNVGGSEEGHDVSTPTRVDLPDGVTATAIAAGPNHSLALGSDGAVYAWGENGSGELGDGSAPQPHPTPVRVELPGGVHASAVATGDSYSLALGSDGAVYAWGANASGDLGDGSTTERDTPVRVGRLPGDVAATAVAASEDHSLAVGANGEVYAWGDPYLGALGGGYQDNDQTTPEVVTLPTDAPAVEVAAGGYTSFAVAGATTPRFIEASPPETAPVGSSVDYTFVASGLPAPVYALASGAPAWLSIDPVTGRLSGTVPQGAASFTVSVTATNNAGSVTAGPFAVEVPSVAVAVSGTALAPGGGALAGAIVDVCLSLGGDCESVSTDGQGAFAATAAAASTVTVTVYPPAGSGLNTDSTGPLTVPAGGLTGVTVALSRPSPLGGGLSVVSGGVDTTPDGQPVLNNTVPAELGAAGCANGIGLLTLVGQNSRTYKYEAEDYPLTESSAGSGSYATALPPQYPIHGPVDIESAIACPTDQGIEPDVGPASGGQDVALSGSGFTGSTAVLFGDTPGTDLEVLADGLIDVTAPAERAGTVSISVSEASGRAQILGTYTYVADDPPGSTSDAPDSASATRLGSTPRHPSVPDSAGATRLTGLQTDPGGSDSSTLSEVLLWVYHHFPGGAAASLRDAIAGAVAAADPGCDTDRALLEDSLHLFLAAAIKTVVGAVAPSLTAGAEVLLSGLVDPVVAALLAPVVASLVKTAAGLILNKLADAAIDAAITAALGPCPHKTNALIDPSGTVLDTNGNPVADAIVTILRSDTQDGTFTPVDVSAPGIEPTTNPETTAADGGFHWDVDAGYYEVQASKDGCTAADGARDDGHTTALIGPYPVPPPQVGLTITMSCPDEDPAPAPVVQSLSVATGDPGGGTDLIVSGSGFTPAATATVGGTAAASVTYLGPDALEITTPAGGPGDVDVLVHSAGGDSATSGGDTFFYGTVPKVTGLDVANGPIAGGTRVTVTGSGFTGATVVGFGGMPGTDLTVDSDTRLEVTSPQVATAGPVDVEVVTPAGANPSEASDEFTYQQRSAQTISFDAPTSAVVGSSATLTANGGGSDQPMVFSVDASSGAGVCVLAGTTLSFTAAGPCVIDANQAGDDGFDPASQVQQTITVQRRTTATMLALAPASVVYGQQAVATVTVTDSRGAAVAGSVQFRVDGHDLGGPVSVDDAGTATSPTLVTGSSLAPGAHPVTAVFTPADGTTYTASTATPQTLTVAAAATVTTLTVHRGGLSATVTAVPPGGGHPTGTVTFSVDRTTVGHASVSRGGTATLAYRVPTGKAHAVAAAYAGDADFTGSSDSTARHDPTIKARLSSSHQRTKYGWYRADVTVTFTCTPHGAPLAGRCPAPVRLIHDGAGQSVTRTVSGTDGGTATAAVRDIDIDRAKPTVGISGVTSGGRYFAARPAARCVGSDALSGLASCTLSRRRHGEHVSYTAVARDRAGNTATARVTVTVLDYTLVGASYRHGAYTVRVGHAYTLLAHGANRPRYVDAAVYPRRPRGLDHYFYKTGHDRWVLGLAISPGLRRHPYWNIGIKVGHTLHTLRIRV